MAISTQRLLLIVLLLNFTLGLVSAFDHNPDSFNINMLGNTNERLEEQEVNMYSEDGKYGSIKNQDNKLEDSAGNSIGWGIALINIFLRGVNPLSIHPDQFEHQMEKAVAYFLIFLRTGLMMLLALEAYMLLKNRKTS